MQKLCVRGTVVFLSVAMAGNAFAEFDFGNGDWRLQVSGLYNFEEADSDPADYFVTGSVEYEFPAYPHGKLGLRLYPLFYYPSAHDVWGAGFGLSTRIYQHHKTFDGLFGEFEASTLWLSDYIECNSSRVNFLCGAGLGYKFPNSGWDISVKYAHISNCGLGDKNTGSNGIGLALGYSF